MLILYHRHDDNTCCILSKKIHNDSDLQAAFKRLEVIFQAQEGTSEFEEMAGLVTAIEIYENKHHPIGSACSADVIKFRLEQQ